MHIELMWKDPNPEIPATTEIWRSTEPFDVDFIGAVMITELPSYVGKYLDTDTVFGTKYYYRLKTKAIGRIPKVSKQYTFNNIPYNGPGPSELQFGDEHFGYYGVIDEAINAAPTINEIRQAIGLAPYPETRNKIGLCHKFVVAGKIRAFYGYPLCMGHEIPESNEQVQHFLNKGWMEFNKGLHKWAVYLPIPVSSEVQDFNGLTFVPGELCSMIDVTTDMYAPVIHNRYGNITGNQITRDGGGIDFAATLAELFPGKTPRHIITSDWKILDSNDIEQTTVLNWTGEFQDYPIRSKSIEPETMPSNEVNWNDCVIWICMDYRNLTQPR